MQERLQQFINTKQLFNNEQNLILAVSGGADSVVMAHLLAKLDFNFAIAHCNFQLRKSESDADQVFTEELAKQLDRPFFTINFNTKIFARNKKIGTQEAARILRYQWLGELSHTQNAIVCTAHHMSDSLETVLINWSRGTGWKGMRGIPIRRDYIARPMMCFSSHEIRQFAEEMGIEFRVDSSNLKDNYLRNAFRHRVIPKWKELIEDIETVNSKNAELISQQISNYEMLLNEFVEREIEMERGMVKIPISTLLRFPHPSVLLYEIINTYGFSQSQCEQIASRLDGLSGAVYSTDSHELIRDRSELILQAKSENQEILIDGPGEFVWNAYKFTVEAIPIKKVKFSSNKSEIWINADDLSLPLTIRNWQDGDRIQPLGMTGTKLVSDVFVDAKIPVTQKKAIPLLCSNSIIWVTGLKQSDEYKISEDSKSAWRIGFDYMED